MRMLPICFCGLILGTLLASAQTVQPPVPPGLHEAEKHKLPVEPPSRPQLVRTDPGQLKHEANELKRLADTVAAEIDQVTKGELPKDLQENLKQIEKLAKRLRGEVAP